MCHSSGHDHAARPQSEGIVGQKKCPGFRRSAQMRIVTHARCWVGPVIACSSSVPCCISARAQRAEKLGGMWLAGRIGQGLANKPNWK